MTPPEDMSQRVDRIHAWYQANILPQRQTYEVSCLWFTFFKQGYNGHQLAKVVRYLRNQISLGKRNEGCLKLQNLLARDEHGSLTNFDSDLALASARDNLRRDKRLAPVPEGESPVPAPVVDPVQPSAKPEETPITPEQRAERVRQLKEFRLGLAEKRTDTTDVPFNNPKPVLPTRIK